MHMFFLENLNPPKNKLFCGISKKLDEKAELSAKPAGTGAFSRTWQWRLVEGVDLVDLSEKNIAFVLPDNEPFKKTPFVGIQRK